MLPKKIIKLFLDTLHSATRDELSLLFDLLVLEFLITEGRQDSELEQQLSERLIEDLKKMKFDLATKLVIALFMQSYHGSSDSYYDFVAQDVNLESLNAAMIKFEPEAKDHKDVVDYMNFGELYPSFSGLTEDLEFALMKLGKSMIKLRQENVEKCSKVWISSLV